MTLSHRLFLLSAVLCAYSVSYAARPATALACFAIVAGRKTTADGSVLVGHNEQNLAPCLISFDRVPRQPIETAIDAKYRYRGGGQRPRETAAYLWSQCIAKDAADSFLNEHGVAVVSNKCPSREDEIDVLVERGEIRDGGLGYLLRRLVAQQATTAREGVLIAGELIERFGYTGTGRTYVIADANEAWLMAIVRGRRWVAQRVPDDAVVVLPNVYIIREVDLSDTANFLASPDLIDYAVGRGWYDRATDGPFDFRRAYRDPFKPGEPTRTEQTANAASASSGNGRSGDGTPSNSAPADPSAAADPPDPRRWWAHQLVTGRTIAWPPASPLPLCIQPSRPMTVAMMAEMLRSRGGLKPLSADTTVEAAVMQLRADMPREIGCVYWRITCEPSSGGMTPWYLGVSTVPEYYHEPVDLARRLSLDYHFNPPTSTFEPNPSLAWWKFRTLQDVVHEDYEGRIGRAREAWAAMETRLLAEQPDVERQAMRLWRDDRQSACDYLTDYCDKTAAEACREADRLRTTLEQARHPIVPPPHSADVREKSVL